jgi:hypothetical protein
MTRNTEIFYTPVYRHYFAYTPPNPRLDNPRLLNDYIDWYMNVYIDEEELPWQWVRERERKKKVTILNMLNINLLYFSFFFLV